jgi:hypothetical protein
LSSTFLGFFKDPFEFFKIPIFNVEDSTGLVGESSEPLDVSSDVFWSVSSQDVPDEAWAVESLVKVNLESYALFLTVQERSTLEFVLVTSGHKSEGFLKSGFFVSIAHKDELLCSCIKHWEKFIIDFLELLDRISGCSLVHIFWLWDTNEVELESCFIFNLLDHLLVLHGPESDASSGLSCSGSSSRSMDVGFDLFWWLNLDNKINIWDIKTS